MSKYELVCTDMFQTLVDIDARIPYIWKRILKEKYDEQIAEQCAKLVNSKVINRFNEYVAVNRKFSNLKSIFEPGFSEIAKEIAVDFNPQEAVSIFMNEHGNAKAFEDTNEFFESIGDSLPICLVSDADIEMIAPLLDRFRFDKVFISESVECYKNEPLSRIFREVISDYDINPQKVIHIGDASSDIIGANKNGIKTCWLNRHGLEWKHDIKPDYTVKSLIEVFDILGLNKAKKVIV
jgi:putative hydrolase of the HAD superfamily